MAWNSSKAALALSRQPDIDVVLLSWVPFMLGWLQLWVELETKARCQEATAASSPASGTSPVTAEPNLARVRIRPVAEFGTEQTATPDV